MKSAAQMMSVEIQEKTMRFESGSTLSSLRTEVQARSLRE
jgi:hypothetical protein